MLTIRKVGIYKDTMDPTWFYLTIHFNSAPSVRYAFPLKAFLEGYDALIPSDRPERPYRRMRGQGVVQALQRLTQRPLDPYVAQAFMEYRITPSVLNRCGNTSQRKVKWVEAQKGNWGGKRK